MAILGLFLLSWVVSSFTRLISEFIPEKNVVLILLKMMLGCPKCSTFWFTLAITFNPFQAALIAFIMYLFMKLEDRFLSPKV